MSKEGEVSCREYLHLPLLDRNGRKGLHGRRDCLIFPLDRKVCRKGEVITIFPLDRKIYRKGEVVIISPMDRKGYRKGEVVTISPLDRKGYRKGEVVTISSLHRKLYRKGKVGLEQQGMFATVSVTTENSKYHESVDVDTLLYSYLLGR